MSDNEKPPPESLPAGRAARGRIAAQTGLKVGANYARYLARRAVNAGDADDERRRLHGRNAEDLFTQLTKLRGTALKLAQGMSMEPGFLPKEFGEVLSQAQYQVPPMSAALVRRLINQNLGDPEVVFASFEANALAAASLGQVHRAVLHDGRTVAVKVQYPNVRESIDSDLRVVRGIAQRFLSRGAIDPYLQEVRERLSEETDYRQEGQNIEFFAEQYTSDRIVTPRWIPELTTQNVLTMTFVEGVHLDSFLATRPSQERKNHFGQILWDFAHAQVAADNLTVHADAHPGNFLFRDDGRIGLLDFGCVKRFPRAFRDSLLRMFRARLADDQEDLLRQYEALELIRSDHTDEQRAFLVEIIDQFGLMLLAPYRSDRHDFASSHLLAGAEDLVERLTGRDALKHRSPVGSPHFVFVNRLAIGFLSMMTKLGAEVHVKAGRELLLSVVD